MFKLVSKFQPAGQQPEAIAKLVEGVRNNLKDQTLMGVTGSGKTFTMANVIKELNMPTLVMAPNKILSAQLYEELKEFFPENAVEYFVSYYDYYRPEAYLPHRGVYIEKEASINEIIDQMRHKATRSLIERDDLIIVASVSCIYGIGSYEAYSETAFRLNVGDKISSADFTRKLCELAYTVSDDLGRGKIRVRGQTIWFGPAHIADRVWRIEIEKNIVTAISEIDPLTRKVYLQPSNVVIFPNTHHLTPEHSLSAAVAAIKQELKEYLPKLRNEGKIAEAQRLEERVNYDLEMLRTNYTCAGIENYSRFFTGRNPGEAPPTLYEYLAGGGEALKQGAQKKPFLLIVDESHITVPQIAGMSAGDASRKNVLVEHGFRLPSCKDNRPLNFEEWDKARSSTIFVSATPGAFEKEKGHIIEQIIRPTGLLDPVCVVKPTEDQVEDAIKEANEVIARGDRVLMLTLTKRTAEHLSEYLTTRGMKVAYLHGEQSTLERIEKLYDFRNGKIDIVVGINLLREGIDVPECALVCIFEADHQGFLRTAPALIQMIGRAARHDMGRVVLYGDNITPAMHAALEETKRRRTLQEAYNTEHGITPQRIRKPMNTTFVPFLESKHLDKKVNPEWLKLSDSKRARLVKDLEKQIKEHAAKMNFEEAAKLRDQRNALMEMELDLLGVIDVQDKA